MIEPRDLTLFSSDGLMRRAGVFVRACRGTAGGVSVGVACVCETCWYVGQGVPGDGRFRRPEDIGVVCTSLIFTCSVLHSAVNSPQYNEYGFPPNYPLILNGSPPTDKVLVLFISMFVCLSLCLLS